MKAALCWWALAFVVGALLALITMAAPDRRPDGQCTGMGAVRHGHHWCLRQEQEARAQRRRDREGQYQVARYLVSYLAE